MKHYMHFYVFFDKTTSYSGVMINSYYYIDIMYVSPIISYYKPL